MRGRRGAVVGVDRMFFHAAVGQFKTNEQRKVFQSKKY
jgi:hypothetical protein